MDYKIYKSYTRLDVDQISAIAYHCRFDDVANWEDLLGEIGAIRVNYLLGGHEYHVIDEEKYFLAKIKYGI